MTGFIIISSFILIFIIGMLLDLRLRGGSSTGCESPIESKLYDALTFNGFNVETQVPCGRYRIDLAIPRYRIAIECDGKAYHSSPNQKAHDRRKNTYLKKHGWKILRFSGRAINNNVGIVVRKVQEVIK